MVNEQRLEVANRVLDRFTNLSLSVGKSGKVYVSWEMGGVSYKRQWQCRGQDFYPTWTRIFPHGGTCSTAVSQLIRWILGKPVLPLSTWRYWASETCKLLDNETVDMLRDAGYPAEAICVLCNERIVGGLDWWSLNKVSGPCCSWRSGCRQAITGRKKVS